MLRACQLSDCVLSSSPVPGICVPRKQKPVSKINCFLLPHPLVEEAEPTHLRVSVAVIKGVTSSSVEGKGRVLFSFTLSPPLSLREVRVGTQGRNCAGSTEERCCWLSPSGLLSLFPHSTQDHLFRPSTLLMVSWVLLHQSSVKEMPQGFLTGRSDGGLFSGEVLRSL